MTETTTLPKADPGAHTSELTYQEHAWRIALCTVGGLSIYVANLSDALDHAPRPGWLVPLAVADALVLGPIALALLAYHRRHPMRVALAITAISAVSAVASLAAVLCLVSIAARRREREIVGLCATSLAAGLVTGSVYPSSSSSSATAPASAQGQVALALVALGVPVALGWYLGWRREQAHAEQQRAQAAEQEQTRRAEEARTQERVRIAREMHDVLAHRISLVSMHAGALGFRDNLPPDTVRDEAQVIQQTANEALAELRGVLGALRSPDGGPAEPPQPLLSDLDALVAQARTAGPVELHRDLAGQDPPSWLGRQAYRIVQECLTNARKHAPGAPARVTLTGRPGPEPDGGLTIEVVNEAPAGPPSAAVGSGLGLVGLAERAAMIGGTLDHGPTPAGGYSVRVRLPWAAQAGDD